jgi:glycosyltransferase involved in cell wall biosynthesis
VSNPSTETIDFLYDWADLFLFTSVSDTQGLVLAEALARQTPALCLEGPGQKDIIKNGHNGFCLESPKEIALMIENLHHNTKLLSLLIDNGIETANQYRKEIIATKIMNFYQNWL